MSDNVFSLRDCPTPYPPWIAGAQLPEIFVTIPLEKDEDLTGASVTMFLTRDTSDPQNPDVLETVMSILDNVPEQFLKAKVPWSVTDLIEGNGQQAVFVLTVSSGETELIGRFNIDVIPNPDPTP